MCRKYAQSEEAQLYGRLRKDILADLISNGIPSSLAGAVTNWYDPAEEDYLQRVDAWQQLLCASYVKEENERYIPQAMVDCHVVTRYHGRMILTTDVYTVNQIHQVVRLLYKYHGIPRKETDWEAVKERFRHPGHLALTPDEVEGVRRVLSALKPPTSWSDLSGRFGPGSTAEGLNQTERWSWKGNLPINVPLTMYDLRLMDHLFGKDANSPAPCFLKYGITKVGEVPKSIKTNRFVSSEPAGFMFAQLGLMDYMYEELHKRFPHNVSLDDAEKHNRLLLQRLPKDEYEIVSSSTHTRRFKVRCAIPFATIDLSDASDHVSRRLVSQLLPDWKQYLFSVRSTFARFPDGEIVPLRTFAPMGSGVCFPVLTAVCLGICKYVCGDLPFSVYGDDIIVPCTCYPYVVELLTKSGLVVNTAKSCSTGMYRESCGREVFNLPSPVMDDTFYPMDITPLFIREAPWKVDSVTLEQWSSKLDQKSWVRTRNTLLDMVPTGIKPTKMRWNHDIQRMEVRVSVRRPFIQRFTLGGQEGLARWYAVRTQGPHFSRKGEDTGSGVEIPGRKTQLTPQWRAVEDFPSLISWLVSSLPD